MQSGQALTGKRASTPKVVKLVSDGKTAVIHKSMGNNHFTPFLWSPSVTLASGTNSVVLSSGVSYQGQNLADYGSIVATPDSDVGSFHLTKDSSTNVVTFVCSSTATKDTNLNVQIMLGEKPTL